MNHKNNTVRNEDIEDRAANDAAFRVNSADIIQELFPNLSPLEKYALASVIKPEYIESLTNQDCSDKFNLAQIPQAVHQYIEYLGGKEKWERRQADPKTRPVWTRREREPQ